MIDLEKLRQELFGPWDVKYDDKGNAVSWTVLGKHNPQWHKAMQTYHIAQLTNSVEELTEGLKSK